MKTLGSAGVAQLDLPGTQCLRNSPFCAAASLHRPGRCWEGAGEFGLLVLRRGRRRHSSWLLGLEPTPNSEAEAGSRPSCLGGSRACAGP